MAGRPPKSVEQHRQENTFRKSRHADKSPQTPPVTDPNLPPPAVLGRAGKALWREKLPLLVEAGHLKQSEIEVFTLYCQAWDDVQSFIRMMHKAQREFQQIKKTYPDKLGIILAYEKSFLTYTEKKNRAVVQFLNFAKALGLTSTDRNKVRADKGRGQNPFTGVVGNGPGS